MIPYDWITGSKMAFLSPFQGDDVKMKSANEFWNSLQSCEFWLLISAIAIGVILAILYYTWWNKIARPGGYHYRIRHWALFLLVSAIACFGGSFIIFDNVVKYPNISAVAQGFEPSLAFFNAFLCILFYFITSLIWCYTPLKTNAYKFLKI